MRFKAHFIRRKSAPFIPSISSSSRKGSVAVSVYPDPPTHPPPATVMSIRDSTISTSEDSLGRGGRDNASTRYVRRPNLAQILADEAQSPWTLDAFTAYAGRNLCLENIEFIQDSRRYKAAYYTVMGEIQNEETATPNAARPAINRMNSAQVEKLRELWTRLIINYIAPSSPKEINLTANIRAGLLPHNKQLMPPTPESLDPAIKKIEELIEDSILFSFLNEVQASVHNSTYQPSVASQERLALETNFSQPIEKSPNASSVHEVFSSSTDPVAPFSAFTPNRPSPRTSQLGGLPPGIFPPGSHKGSAASATNSIAPLGSGAASIAPTLSEDSGSVGSPVVSQHEQRTPPRTPPSHENENKKSPKNNDRWKRMSQRFGFHKKSGTALRDVQEDPPPPIP